jgi:hypothetical protein
MIGQLHETNASTPLSLRLVHCGHHQLTTDPSILHLWIDGDRSEEVWWEVVPIGDTLEGRIHDRRNSSQRSFCTNRCMTLLPCLRDLHVPRDLPVAFPVGLLVDNERII